MVAHCCRLKASFVWEACCSSKAQFSGAAIRQMNGWRKRKDLVSLCGLKSNGCSRKSGTRMRCVKRVRVARSEVIEEEEKSSHKILADRRNRVSQLRPRYSLIVLPQSSRNSTLRCKLHQPSHHEVEASIFRNVISY